MIKAVEEGLEIYKEAVREYLNFIQPYVIAHGNDFMGKLVPVQKMMVHVDLLKLEAMAKPLALTEEEIKSIQKEVAAEFMKAKTE